MKTAFGSILRRKRELANFTRTSLAELVQLHPSYLSRLEAGTRKPSRDVTLSLAEALQITGPELDEWLTAAGYAPMPLLSMVRGATRARGGTLHQLNALGPPRRPEQWATWLDSLGLDELTVGRLMKAMENGDRETRRTIANAISKMFLVATRQFESKVHTAVIPAATENRLVATHIAQRMILSAIGEAANAGISRIVLILAPDARERLFTTLKDVCQFGIGLTVDLEYCLQLSPDGLGDAILQAESIVGSEPFAVLLPDDVVRSRSGRVGQRNTTFDLITALNDAPNASLLAVSQVSRPKLSQCGATVVGEATHPSILLPVEKLIEKPGPMIVASLPPATLGVVGRFLLQPTVFRSLQELRKKNTKPLHLTTALEGLRQSGELIYALEVRGGRYDIGEMLGQASEMIDSVTQRI